MNCELCMWMPVGLTREVVCQRKWKSCVRETGFWNAMSNYIFGLCRNIVCCSRETAKNAEKSWSVALKGSIQWVSPGHTENTQHQLKILQQPRELQRCHCNHRFISCVKTLDVALPRNSPRGIPSGKGKGDNPRTSLLGRMKGTSPSNCPSKFQVELSSPR